MAKSQYDYGREKERQVAKRLRRKGYDVTVHEGSRGASDLEAKKGAKKWVVQVRATRKNLATRIPPKGRQRLKIQASKKGAIAVHADVVRGAVKFKSVRTGQSLKP